MTNIELFIFFGFLLFLRRIHKILLISLLYPSYSYSFCIVIRLSLYLFLLHSFYPLSYLLSFLRLCHFFPIFSPDKVNLFFTLRPYTSIYVLSLMVVLKFPNRKVRPFFSSLLAILVFWLNFTDASHSQSGAIFLLIPSKKYLLLICSLLFQIVFESPFYLSFIHFKLLISKNPCQISHTSSSLIGNVVDSTRACKKNLKF